MGRQVDFIPNYIILFPIVILIVIKTFRTFIRKYIKYSFYVSLFLVIKEWADLLKGVDLGLLRLMGNTALTFSF